MYKTIKTKPIIIKIKLRKYKNTLFAILISIKKIKKKN